MLRGCRLSGWQFDHLVASQEPFRPYHWTTDGSPYVDLSAGWEGYRAAQMASHRGSFRKFFQKSRRCEREIGPVRLELHTAEAEVFEAMIAWKREQYQRTGVADVLAFDWTEALLREVLSRQGEEFSGVMSALYLGDTLSAVLLSMRSRDVLHAWFSAYGPQYADFSPGLVLWIEMVQACAAAGIRRIDLGKGRERYKGHLTSGTIEVAEGAVRLRSLAGVLQKGWHHTCEWVRQSPLRKPLLKPARLLRRMADSRRLKQ
jgi:CelD/BcsL family acetyltransferase involved in cellulose biosynthesis